MKLVTLLFVLASIVSMPSMAQNDAKYTGKIKSIYLHERPKDSYFGVELVGRIDNNPCGAPRDRFILSPNDLSDRLFTMLLAAHAANKEVAISNSNQTADKRCHGAYPTLNSVRIY